MKVTLLLLTVFETELRYVSHTEANVTQTLFCVEIIFLTNQGLNVGMIVTEVRILTHTSSAQM